jgi:hydroxymethylglutaryl-CoA lyase
MAERIEVHEVGLRDGLQNIKTVVPTDLKLAWIKAEADAGVKEIEVCSFVPPKLLPQFADAEDVVRGALKIPGLTVSGLMPNLKGAERGAALGVHKLNYVVSVSEGHNMSNVRRTTGESLADLKRIAEFLQTIPAGKRPKLFCGLATSFGCTIEGHVPHDRVVMIAEAVAAIGVDEIGLADTVGFGNPAAVRTLFTRVLQAVGSKFALLAHFHDTRGLGIANVAAAIEAGVRAFDASLCGLGGCPYAPGATGNVVTEDVVFLAESLGFDTGIDLEKLIEVRKIVAQALPGEALYGQTAKAGLPKGFAYAERRRAA